MIKKICLSVLMAMVCSFAAYSDFYFQESLFNGGLCVARTPANKAPLNAQARACGFTSFRDVVRIRIFEPAEDLSSRFRIAVKRPFFILDGIYLSTEGVRTLSELEDEANRLGIMDVLVELGYTPVLVQFSETVRRPMIYFKASAYAEAFFTKKPIGYKISLSVFQTRSKMAWW